MELREAILGRRSVRRFTADPVDAPAVAALKEAVLWAPSAGNLQARKFYLVTNAGVRRALGAATHQPSMFAAPLVVVACADHRIQKHYGARGRELYALQDVAAAVQNLLLTAHARGLGACWVGAFREEEVRRALSLPDHLRPVALVPVGVPAEAPAPPPRVAETVAFESVD